MKISFDLDDTLILLGKDCPQDESITPRLTSCGKTEFLRQGTRELFQTLHADGWEIVIYTASTRGTADLMKWFRCCRLPISEIVSPMNETREFLIPVKHPPTYGIDLHVDDCQHIAADGERHGFKVLLISPDDAGWATKVLQAAATIHAQSHPPAPQARPQNS